MIIDEPEAQLIYLAGIVDGEGHICLTRQTKRKNGNVYYHDSPRIIVSNTNLELLEWLTDNFGGSYYTSKKPSDRYKQCYAWSLVGRNAIELGKRLEPYLIVKREQLKRIIGVG